MNCIRNRSRFSWYHAQWRILRTSSKHPWHDIVTLTFVPRFFTYQSRCIERVFIRSFLSCFILFRNQLLIEQLNLSINPWENTSILQDEWFIYGSFLLLFINCRYEGSTNLVKYLSMKWISFGLCYFTSYIIF